jgi:hypothetical protein
MMSTTIPGQTTTLKYRSTSEVIANPERGWYDDYYSYSGGTSMGTTYRPLKASEMLRYRVEDKITLILRLFYLHPFLEEDSVSQEYLEWMQHDFDSIRSAGVKCIVRFAYSASQRAEVWDATPEKVFSHIESLGDVLMANGDVIAGVQAGFIGAWGEWYYTKNFAGNGYYPTATDQQNRRILVEKLLAVLPEHVSVQGRTPAIMRNITGTTDPITEAEAFDGSLKSRTGHHNDCFLADASDYGTYGNLEKDLAYLSETTKYTITGGETCDASNTYSDCVNGVPRMTELHWTYLNRDYNRDVYDKWIDQDCYDEINIAMGYRIHLVSATLPVSAGAGSDLPLSFIFSNLGYAAPTQYKPIQVVLTRLGSGEQTILDYRGSHDDIRYWLPGEIRTEGSVSVPAQLAGGNYSLALRFADKDPRLSTNPAYSIRLANVGTWDEVQGINMLNYVITVGSGGEGTLPMAPLELEAATVSETEISLSWMDGSDDETGFEIMRSSGETNIWEPLVTLTPDVESYTDNQASRGTWYSYIIRAVNDYGSSPWSDSARAATLGVTVQTPLTGLLEFYPNPLDHSDLTIHFPDHSGKKVVITTVTGVRIFGTSTRQRTLQVDRQLFQPGLHLITLYQGNQVTASPLVVR